MIENFFGLLKSERLYLQKFQSAEHFKILCCSVFRSSFVSQYQTAPWRAVLFVQISQTCPQFIDKAQIMEAYIFVP